MLAPASWIPPEGSEESGDSGSAGCMVELELGSDRPQWIFHRAGPGDVVGLFSAQRLPSWTELGPRSRSHAEPIRIPAAVGDVVVLFTPAAPWVVDPGLPGHPVREGGPALLDVFETELRRAPVPFACLVIDLR